MRDTKTWRTGLARELANMESVYGSLNMSFAQFLDTELILTLMNDHLPGQNPELAWAIILGGHPSRTTASDARSIGNTTCMATASAPCCHSGSLPLLLGSRPT
jgi:hypothetical protein